MNTIDLKLKELKKKKKLGLMAHAVLGYPTVEKSLEIIKTLIASGADFLELQIPFSDPVADGETIMKACEVALKNGMNTDRAFELIETTFSHELFFADVRRPLSRSSSFFTSSLSEALPPEDLGNSKVSKRQVFNAAQKTHTSKLDYLPIIIMCYYNQIFRYGIEKFCKKASQSGVSGLIVPDIPPEEEKNEKFISTCIEYNLYPIRVVSPSSSIGRLKINSKFARGFVYCVSHFGVTGSQTTVNQQLINYIKRVKQVMKLPVAVGFGIEKSQQIEKLQDVADIAIVGSAIIKTYDAGGINKVSSFIKAFKKSTI